MNTTIYETTNFILEVRELAHIDRLDGGHLVIAPKVHKDDIKQLAPDEATEFINLTILAGKAMKVGLQKSGIDIQMINYQINGNFNKSFHLHLYGRSTHAKIQKYGNCIQHGPTKELFIEQIKKLTPLNEADIKNIKDAIKHINTGHYTEMVI